MIVTERKPRMETKANGVRLTLTDEETKGIIELLEYAIAVHDLITITNVTTHLTLTDRAYVLAGNIIDQLKGVYS